MAFLVYRVCIFTVHTNRDLELKQHTDECPLHTGCFDIIHQQFRSCHKGHDVQSRMITLEIWRLHKAFQTFASSIPLLIAFVSKTEKQKHQGACQPYYDGLKEAADKSVAPQPIPFSGLCLALEQRTFPPDLQPSPPIKDPLVWPLTDMHGQASRVQRRSLN